jgi:hypothetical protein
MGIRFFCPNGHKLNVKEHLVGKSGFCPECGARLTIPLQSTRKSSKEMKAEAVSAPRESLLTAEAEQPEPVTVQSVPEDNNINPILQDQTVVWYIQVPDGPQYGPATGQVVHSWILERRIGPTMLIWREGWANWLEAKNVFPELENVIQ